ncbi:arylsulfatase [Microbacterium sp. Leaf320]|uniref:arylsulfatase n=1 Tax=Microbacterium sp. Leaf320 TaxID=1736334 RepID=UPI0006FCA279|nr:arylsulfatase [Microbacterium sp. Leaf320]KQQ65364.1 arylsulfatase [Microbacterium sp. Leaf320]
MIGFRLSATPLTGGESLPFTPTPSGSTAGITMQDSTYSPRPRPARLPEDAPNIVIILIDDAGPGLPEPLGGEVRTPHLGRILQEGVSFNRFHTTAMCSPTRASLLTGRNQHRVGAGQIAEFANDWDGYSGRIPREAAPLPEILRHYGYATSAFGKWHNTPSNETHPAGPYDNWPTGLGFEYFYGFLAGEASQYEPNLVRNTTSVLPPRTPEEGYHLSEDLADDAISWLHQHKTLRAHDPFFMYWASGAIHGPHHVASEWADKYAGQFDDGWDAYRERAHARAIERGWIPAGTELTPRDPELAAWEDIPEEERAFQARLMEVAAGFAEHVDHQVGRILDELDTLGYTNDTLVFYIWGDNGSSAEGQNGTISELLAQNGIPSTIAQHIDTLEELGGLPVLGSPKVDNMYHAGWAWAGSTPYKGMKLLASHLGGTRNPLAIRWPSRIAPDARPRTQFHHCNDIVPTILEITGIPAPTQVNGVPQKSLDGTSMVYALEDPHATGRVRTQYFEVMGSRAIYHDGWMACARGPRLPWKPGLPPGIHTWTPNEDVWELYNLDTDWSQAHDLAAEHPERLTALKELFLVESARNDVLPVGGGLWIMALHPEDRPQSPYTEWEMFDSTTRIPESAAPTLGNRSSVVTFDVDLEHDASGVLFKLGQAAGGMTVYMDEGRIHYEYNLFLISRTHISTPPLPGGPATITIRSTRRTSAPDSAMDITIEVNGDTLTSGTVPVLANIGFSANDGLDIGRALGSPVSLAYADRAPFPFTGQIRRVHMAYV